MADTSLSWSVLASVFPPTLDTDTNPAKLPDGATPDSYGLGLDAEGLLYKASIPTGTSKVKKTYTIGANDWTWYFRRLWRMSGAELLYNAPEYTALVLLQGRGVVSFDEDANSLVTFLPFGDSMFVAKSTGGYIIPNAASRSGRYEHLNIMEEMAVASANNAIEMDGRIWVSNASGIYMYDGNKVNEVTDKVQGGLTPFASQTLTIQQARRRIVCGTTGVVDAKGNLYRYDGTKFRFTSRMLTSGSLRPFPVKALGFLIDNPNKKDGVIKYQIRTDGDWSSTVYELNVQGASGQVYFAETALDDLPQSRQFQLRIEDIDAGIRIRTISVLAKVVAAEESYPK